MKNLLISLMEFLRNIAVIIVLLIGLFILALVYSAPFQEIITEKLCQSSNDDDLDELFTSFTYIDQEEDIPSKTLPEDYVKSSILKRKIILPLKSSGFLIIEPSEIEMIFTSESKLMLLKNANDTISLSSSSNLNTIYNSLAKHKTRFFKNRERIISFDHINKIYTKPIKGHKFNKSNYYISTSTIDTVEIPQSSYEELKNIFKP